MRIVSGIFRNRILAAPKTAAVRPSAEALREALFNICRNSVEEARVLDLFAGSGAIGLEALSRGAQHVTFVDVNRDAIRCIHDNIRTLAVESLTQVIPGDVLKVLDKILQQGKTYDLVFADPPYEKGPAKGLLFSQLTLEKIDGSSLLKSDGHLFIEEAATIELKDDHLSSLKLKSRRRLGSTSLHHYVKI